MEFLGTLVQSENASMPVLAREDMPMISILNPGFARDAGYQLEVVVEEGAKGPLS